MAQLMPLPLTISCSSKIQIGFIFVVPARLGSPGQRDIKRVCVCVSQVTQVQRRRSLRDIFEIRAGRQSKQSKLALDIC